MEEWKIQCINCSKFFDGYQAVSCKCFYQFPTKICPYCLKCFCGNRQAYKGYWKNLPNEERKKIIGSKAIWKWLKEINLLTDGDIEDILQEAKKLKGTFMKASYKLGYFSKEEVEKIKEIIYYNPDIMLEKIKEKEQRWDIWEKYKGLLLDTANLNNQIYNVVIFPIGVSETNAFKVQTELKKLIIPIYVELNFWKILAEEAKFSPTKEKNKKSISFSLKEWFIGIIDEAISEGKEEILIEADINNESSKVFFNQEGKWFFHSSSDIPFRSLSWSIKNLIPEEGKKIKDDFYVNRKIYDDRIFIIIEPFKFNKDKGLSSIIDLILKMMQLRKGVFLIISDSYMGTFARSIIFFAKEKYSLAVNDLSITNEEVPFFKVDQRSSIKMSTKYIALVNNEWDIEEIMKISSMNFVLAFSKRSLAKKIIEKLEDNLIKTMYFWKLNKLCNKCKTKANKLSFNNVSLWQRNEKGCSLCKNGFIGEMFIFEEYNRALKDIISSLLVYEEIDWRDLSYISPKALIEVINY